jgi:hypothetical protein
MTSSPDSEPVAKIFRAVGRGYVCRSVVPNRLDAAKP